MQARRWANSLRDIADPLADLPAVKKGVRGLLDVCKNGAHPGEVEAGQAPAAVGGTRGRFSRIASATLNQGPSP